MSHHMMWDVLESLGVVYGFTDPQAKVLHEKFSLARTIFSMYVFIDHSMSGVDCLSGSMFFKHFKNDND